MPKNNQPEITFFDLQKFSLEIAKIRNSLENLSQAEIIQAILDLESDWDYVLEPALISDDLNISSRAKQIQPQLQDLHYDLHQKLTPVKQEELKLTKLKLTKLFFELKSLGFEDLDETTPEQDEVIKKIYEIVDLDLEKALRNYDNQEIQEEGQNVINKVYQTLAGLEI